MAFSFLGAIDSQMTANSDAPRPSRPPMAGEVKAAWISAGALLLTAVIGGGVMLLIDLKKPEGLADGVAQGDHEAAKLSFESITELPQPVNEKDVGASSSFPADIKRTEFATFRFVVRNTSNRDAHVDRGTLLIDDVERISGGAETKMMVYAIDHANHVEAWIETPSVGDRPAVPIVTSVPADSVRKVTVWFKSNDAPGGGALILSARLRLSHDGHESTSGPFRIVIHSDSAEMHYGTDADQPQLDYIDAP